jgi:2-dehydropantoate 2-reductase
VRIAIIGAGGVGGYYGAHLARAGEDVTLIARGAHLAAMRERGLVIRAGGTEETFAVRATDDPASVGTVDLAIIAVKLWGTAEAARSALPLLGPETAVVSLQNGVDKDDEIAAIVGSPRVLGGVTYIAAQIAEPGVLAIGGISAKLLFGEFDTTRSARVDAFAAAAQRAGLDHVVPADIRCAIWEKFAFLTTMSGATALMRTGIGPIRSHPGSRRILTALLEEAAAVAHANGIALPEDYVAERLAAIDTYPAGQMASMARDLLAGNRIEVPWLSGAVVRIGNERGVPTPTHAFVVDALAPYVDGPPVLS